MKEGWEETTLGEVVSFKGGGTPSTERSSYWNGDIPWVSPKDMKSAEIGDSIDKITSEAIENSAASLIPEEAILIVVRSGILARTVPVAIPPLDVQQRLAMEIASLAVETERLQATYDQKLKAISELKQSILRKAFSGELTSALCVLTEAAE